MATPFPRLSLDVRRKTLEEFSGRAELPIIEHETDRRIAIVAADPDGEFTRASTIVDRLNAWERTVNEMRMLAIVPTMASGVREVVHDGYRCRVCATRWSLGRSEQHQSWCVLRGSEQ